MTKRRGFTLIELLIAVVIIGVLAMISISLFWRTKDRGLEASLQADLKTAAVRQEHYFDTHSTYAPTQADIPDFHPSAGVSLDVTYAATDGWAAIATHQGLARRCGLFVGAAPAGSAGPATTPGILQCGP
jgi:prepilin-type N-terminal cleavage/methylation domain-containing protein